MSSANWSGRIAIVTGGNSGIGHAIAHALAAMRMRVAIAGRRAEHNESVADELRTQYEIEAIPVQADVSCEADCRALIRSVVDHWGAIDLLVNNAGVFGGGSVAETETAAFDQTMRTNLYGAFWCAREAFPHLAGDSGAGGGSVNGYIINIASLCGVEAWAGTGTYSASKFGMVGLTQSLADEGKAGRVKATAICPALVATDMAGAAGEEILQPSDIAETVRWLLALSPACWPVEVVLPRRDAS